MHQTFQDRVWPVFDDLIWDTDYYPSRAKAQLASELRAQALELERFERQCRLVRKRARRAWYVRWQPIIWSLVVLALLWLGLGGAHWLVGL
jgi:hypothetical protein